MFTRFFFDPRCQQLRNKNVLYSSVDMIIDANNGSIDMESVGYAIYAMQAEATTVTLSEKTKTPG